MTRIASTIAVLAVTLTFAACSGGTMTSPSPLSPSAASLSVVGADGTRATTAADNSDVLSDSDRQFVASAAMSNQAMIEFGTLAERLADLPEVKQFALQMIQNATVAMEGLRGASSNSVQSNITLDAAHQQTFGQLSALHGSDFDRAYMAAVVQEHQAMVASYQPRGSATSSAALRDYVQSMLPNLLSQLQRAQELMARVRVTRIRIG
jgi:putative membrane protein